MNIFKIRLHLNEIERLRTTKALTELEQKQLTEAIEIQVEKIESELRRSARLTTIDFVNTAAEHASKETQNARARFNVSL